MRRFLGFLLFLLILAGGYLYVALYLPYQGFPSGGVYVDIPHGASQRTIARMLSQNGVVRSRLPLKRCPVLERGAHWRQANISSIIR